LFSIHATLAVIAKEPAIALTERESETLAKAAQNVALHYHVAASEKALAWGNLAITIATIYGPRAYLIIHKNKPGEQNVSRETSKNPPEWVGGLA